MGFTISVRCGEIGRATHRRGASEALTAARAYAAEAGAQVQIISELGELFTLEAFAAALAQGRFRAQPAG